MGPDEAAGMAWTTVALPLIPREAFFGNPAKAGGQISPDGRWLSWLAARNGVLNVWVAPLGAPDAARPLTDEAARPVTAYFWSMDGSTVLYLTDPGGHENLQLFGVDPASGERRPLTRFENARVQAPKLSRRIPGRILIQANSRDPRYFDVLALDLKTGALTTVFENDGFGDFLADEGLELRIATRPIPSGDVALHRIENGKAAAEPFDLIPFEDVSTTGPIGYSFDGATLYWRDSRGRDTAALIAEDVATGARTVIAEDPRADLGEMIFDPNTGRAQAYATHYLRPKWTALDPAIAGDLAFLKGRFAGEITITSRTTADDRWTVAVTAADSPGEAWLYERATKDLTRLYTTRPELEGQSLARMLPFEISSRDGWTLVSYLTLPPGTDPGGDGRPAEPLPLVLFVHGGPWWRDYYGYNAVHQWLANRGYAVLSVNFRASTGLGKRFCAAGDREWGAKMQDDLLDAVDWAVARCVTTKDRVTIFGGSYGGYATLAALTFTPETFVCGVDLFGPSNLNTLLATTPSYWASMLSMLHRRMGDPTTPEGQALLRERSPVFAADAIRRPLLIAQGANDARVKQAESDQIVEAMQAKGIPVTYLLFDDEGHGFARPDNNLAFFAATELFLAQHLGGRAEPMPSALPGATMRILEGADLIPGLSSWKGA
jgi:dipeptidyl aminopeptidase/acylaminoacyl peptidase